MMYRYDDSRYGVDDRYSFPNSAPPPEDASSVQFSRAKAAPDKPDDDGELDQSCGAILGSLLGAIGGCLLGLGFAVIPGVGPVIALGTWESTLVGTILGASTGAVGCSLLENLSRH